MKYLFYYEHTISAFFYIMFFSRKFFNNIGIVESVGDGIVNILGLQNVANGEMVEICILTNLQGIQTQKALVLNLGPR
jgi:F0F1-type ATP synthase alpha subunit